MSCVYLRVSGNQQKTMAVNTLLDFITQLGKIKRDPNFFYFFRGHSDTAFKLQPSIYRSKKFITHEDIIFKEAMLRTPHEFVNEKTTLEKLVKIQHYGVPTRLLDITSNPLVALYFACNQFNWRDGKVIVFKIPKNEIKYYDSDTVSILSNLCKRPHTFNLKGKLELDRSEFNDEEDVQYLLHEIREEKSYFLPLINPKDLGRVLAVKVKYNNNRIVRQDGAFLIFGIRDEKIKSASIPIEWIETDLKIAQINKVKLIKDLDNLGISQATLFPELQSLGDYLKDIYKQ